MQKNVGDCKMKNMNTEYIYSPFILANGRYRWAYHAQTSPRPSIDEVFGTQSKLQGAGCKLGGVATTSVVMRCTSVDFVAIYSEWLKRPIAEQNSCEEMKETRWREMTSRQGPERCNIDFWSESMHSLMTSMTKCHYRLQLSVAKGSEHVE